MKFVAVEDIAVPIEEVWPHVSDFDGFERRIARRVGDVTRTPPGPAGQGTEWRGRTEVMGKAREVSVTVETITPPETLLMRAETDGMVVTIDVQLVRQGPRLTRLTVTSEAKARSLAARLMLQSARLARKTLAKRYKGRVSDFAANIERSVRPG